jgi:biotin operon repressor
VNEIVALSKRERDRLVVLRQVQEGKLTQRVAAEQLGLSRRWLRKLVGRLRAEGDQGLAHQLRGRPSNRAHEAALRRQALDLIRKNYADYGPTLAAEVLAEEHSIRVNRETLRQWMSQERLWKPRRAKLKKIHVWRPRRSCRGSLVQWDTSEHEWLDGRGPKLYLVALIDDATSELTAQFALSDSTAANMALLGRYLRLHGRPAAVYTDKASLFQVNPPLHHNKHLDAEPAATQIGRALGELGIERITAHSPQAKGRVERCFGTLQDRLVKGLRRRGAKTLEEANRYLEQEFEADWKKRFGQAAAEEQDAHRPLRADQDLGSILSHIEQRVAGNDYTISLWGKRYQIPAELAQPRMRGRKVEVEQRLDGGLWVRWQEMRIELRECVAGGAEAPASQPEARSEPVKPKAAKAAKKPKAKSRWMENFHLGRPGETGRPLSAAPVALRAPCAADNGA